MFRIGNLSRFLQMLILLFGAGMVLHAGAARADDLDPFANTTGQWMSFDRYNDNIKRNRPVGNEAISMPKIETPEVDVPAEPVKTVDSIDQNAVPEGGKNPDVVVAEPTRPLDLPILPAMNSGYNIPVETTASDNVATSPAQIVQKDDGNSDLHFKEQNWQDAAEIARQHADERNGVNADNDHPPIEVRLSFLPDPKIVPAFNAPKKPRLRMVEVPTAPKPIPAVAEAPKTAECAAVDMYKKKQLEDIQSDRQTLQALQAAISDLGLQKQLNFMTEVRQTPISAGQNLQVPGATVTATP